MAAPQFIKVNHDSEITTPFEGDLWGRYFLAERLEDFITPLNIGMTIALNSEWGAGKTWFVKHWMKQLKDNEFKVIYLDAFAQDYVEDPFVSISMEIAKCLEDEKSDTKKLVESIGDIYRAALPSLPMILWAITTTLMGAGALAKPVADVIERLQNDSGNAGKEVGTLLNEQLKEHLSAQVENYDNEKKSLQFFKNELIRLTQDLPKPLVFVIDELDRCKPEFAIRLIERIKHFFDVPNIVFLLSVNKKQLEQSINSFYGFSQDASYLEKFIDITISLNSRRLSQYDYERILKEYGGKIGVNLTSLTYELVCELFMPNARQLIKVLNKFSFLNAKHTNERANILFIILIFLELKLIQEFNQKNFFKYFLDANKASFYKIWRQKNSQNNSEITFESYLKSLYIDMNVTFEFLESQRLNSLDYSSSEHLVKLFPSRNYEGWDLIIAWLEYIEMGGHF